MRYIKHIVDGYIVSLQTNAPIGTENCTEEEYNNILHVLKNQPTPKDGYGYRLKEDLSWEEYELPVEEIIEEATEADYINALGEMGVDFNE